MVVSHDLNQQSNSISFSETNVDKAFCVVYTLHRKGPALTRAEANAYIRWNPFRSLIFHIFFRKKLRATYDQTWNNLALYCQGLIREGKQHHNLIVTGVDGHAQAVA